MSKFKSKLARRIMAIVLSGAMVMSNMSAYAAELAPETETTTEVVSEVEEPAATENTADTAKEEAVSDADEESTEEDTIESASDDKSEADIEDEGMSAEEQTETEEAETTETESDASDENDVRVTGTPHEFDATTIPVPSGTTTNKLDIAEGTTYSDGYFKIVGKVQQYTNSEYTKTNSVEVGNNGSGAIQFTTKGVADISVDASSNGGSNISDIALIKSDNTIIEATTITGSAKKEGALTYSDLPAGTYSIQSKAAVGATPNSRIVRVYKITVVEADAEGQEPVDRGSWEDEVAKPTIVEPIAYTKGEKKITVTVKGVVNPTGVGADKVEVDMYNANAPDENTTAVTMSSSKATKADENGDHLTTFEFTPEESGSYYFVARLARNPEGETTFEDKETDITQDAVGFILPLATPVISTANFKGKDTNGKGTITVAWNEVEEATRYIVSLSYTDAANEEKTIESKEAVETSIDISGLELNSVVTAMRRQLPMTTRQVVILTALALGFCLKHL